MSVARMKRQHRWRKNLRNTPMGLLLVLAAPLVALASVAMWVKTLFGRAEER